MYRVQLSSTLIVTIMQVYIYFWLVILCVFSKCRIDAMCLLSVAKFSIGTGGGVRTCSLSFWHPNWKVRQVTDDVRATTTAGTTNAVHCNYDCRVVTTALCNNCLKHLWKWWCLYTYFWWTGKQIFCKVMSCEAEEGGLFPLSSRKVIRNVSNVWWCPIHYKNCRGPEMSDNLQHTYQLCQLCHCQPSMFLLFW